VLRAATPGAVTAMLSAATNENAREKAMLIATTPGAVSAMLSAATPGAEPAMLSAATNE